MLKISTGEDPLFNIYIVTILRTAIHVVQQWNRNRNRKREKRVGSDSSLHEIIVICGSMEAVCKILSPTPLQAAVSVFSSIKTGIFEVSWKLLSEFTRLYEWRTCRERKSSIIRAALKTRLHVFKLFNLSKHFFVTW